MSDPETASPAYGGSRSRLLVGLGDLSRWRSDGEPVTVLEVHRAREVPVAEYRLPPEGVLPGAVPTVVERDFAGERNEARSALPLPDPEVLAERARLWGATRGDTVVLAAADPQQFTAATRAWLALVASGFRDVRLLDPGLGVTTAPAPSASVPMRRPHDVALTQADDLARERDRGIVLDARSATEFAGDRSSGQGHVPGAIWLPSTEVAARGSLKSELRLRKWFLRHGIIGHSRITAYCGTSAGSSALVFALATLGVRSRVYIPSWEGWRRRFPGEVAFGDPGIVRPGSLSAC